MHTLLNELYDLASRLDVYLDMTLEDNLLLLNFDETLTSTAQALVQAVAVNDRHTDAGYDVPWIPFIVFYAKHSNFDPEQFVGQTTSFVRDLIRTAIQVTQQIADGAGPETAANEVDRFIAHASAVYDYAFTVLSSCTGMFSTFSMHDVYTLPAVVRTASDAHAAAKHLLCSTVHIVSCLAFELHTWRERADEFIRDLAKRCNQEEVKA